MKQPLIHRLANASIWYFAFGYFACYIPYSALTKAISSGRIPGYSPIPGVRMLPLSLAVSVLVMITFVGVTGLWRYAHTFKLGGLSIPYPSRGPFFSGLCVSAIIASTTLAYTFAGISIVFAMLLMRGGVLMIAPVIDAMSQRKTHWYSWAGLALSLLALVVAFAEKGGLKLTLIAGIDIAVYLSAYFVRLRLMSRYAKSDDPNAQLRYFTEEQLVGPPMSFFLVALGALFLDGEFGRNLALGFSPSTLGPALWGVLLIGFFSQFTGIFGGLILLNKQENTYCVPVNRSSSILAGVIASFVLTVWLNAPAPSPHKLTGAGLIIGAILVLSIPPLLQKLQARKEKRQEH